MNSEELSKTELAVLTMVGKNVKFIRRTLLNLKLHELSDKTKISRDVLCRLEALSKGDGSMGKGRIYPSLSTLIKFCDGTGIQLSDLLDRDIEFDSDIQKKIMNKIGVENSNLKAI